MSKNERIPLDLGASIRAWRRKHKLTIAQLAERAGIDTGFLAYIETGKKLPSLHTAAKLADALGITLSQLFHGVPATEKGRGFRAEVSRLAQTLCLKCTRQQADDLLAVFKLFDDPRKVRAIRVLIEA